METINPTTGEKIASYAEFSSAEVERILANAQKEFHYWRKASFKERGVKVKKAAEILRKNKDQYARLMAAEMGKPLLQGQAEIEKCAWVCDFYAEQAQGYLLNQSIKTDASKSFVRFEPLGTILAIMPWNFPFWQVFRCAAPTLMAGNTIVLKHASNVCGSALAIEEIFLEAGFPENLFRSILITGKKSGELIKHPLIAAVTLTGSTAAGKEVASLAGSALKKTVLELGGSDPYIILEDADISRAAETCVSSRMTNGGQSCVAAKRFIVVEPVFDVFVEKFVENMKAQRMGPPLEEGTMLGPLARRDLLDQLHAQVCESISQGAQCILGGVIPQGPGAFYLPTVLINVQKEMIAYKEELFGPVASIIRCADEREAIHIANDTVFGLGSAIFSRDVERAQRIAQELQAGCCFINDSVKSDPRLPFGGIKESGYGRELSIFGIQEFVNIKTVYVK